MMSDEDELDRLNWNEERTGRAEAARDDPGRNPQPNAELPSNSRVVGSTAATTREATSCAVNVGVGTEDNDGIPFGQVAEDPNDDDEPMEEADEPPLLADPSDDEAGPAAPYEPESESDDDEEDGI